MSNPYIVQSTSPTILNTTFNVSDKFKRSFQYVENEFR